MPPLEQDGTSHLWEALGRRFTGMSYSESDLYSSENKSFVRDLCPSGMIYASLLSQHAGAPEFHRSWSERRRDVAIVEMKQWVKEQLGNFEDRPRSRRVF